MADFSLGASQRFLPGTVVGAYLESAKRVDAAPEGAAVATETMGSSGLTFTGLTDETRYVAYAQVSGEHRYVGFIAGADSTDAAIGGLSGTVDVNVVDGALGFSLGDPVDGLGTVRTVQTVAFSHSVSGESAAIVAAPGAGLQLIVLGGLIYAAGPGQIVSGAGGPVKAHYDTPGAAFNLGGFPAVILDENDALLLDNDGATATKGHLVVVARDVP